MSIWHRLLYLLGLRRDPHPHTYTLDTHLHTAIAELARQQQRSPNDVAEGLLDSALQREHHHHHLWQRWQSLSPREQQAAALACLGFTNAQIALKLGISPETAKTHLHNVFVKFAITSRKELRLLLEGWDFSSFL